MYSATSAGRSMFSSSAFLRRIATRVSKSGFWMSTISPEPKRERRRSSMVGSSFGGRSDEMMICLPLLYRSLKVWKNSSCVAVVLDKNWMSSTINTSTLRIFARSSAVPFFLTIASISSFVKRSEVVKSTRDIGRSVMMKLPMAFIRCVLPRPTSPYRNSGL